MYQLCSTVFRTDIGRHTAYSMLSMQSRTQLQLARPDLPAPACWYHVDNVCIRKHAITVRYAMYQLCSTVFRTDIGRHTAYSMLSMQSRAQLQLARPDLPAPACWYHMGIVCIRKHAITVRYAMCQLCSTVFRTDLGRHTAYSMLSMQSRTQLQLARPNLPAPACWYHMGIACLRKHAISL